MASTLAFDRIVHLFQMQMRTMGVGYVKNTVPLMPGTFEDFRGVVFTEALAYEHDNGKVRPSKYGCQQSAELWLCFATFNTPYRCKYGVKCHYRHAKLEMAEVLYIALSDVGKEWLVDRYLQCWSKNDGWYSDSKPVVSQMPFPIVVMKEVPVPSANKTSAAQFGRGISTGAQSSIGKIATAADAAAKVPAQVLQNDAERARKRQRRSRG